MFNSLIDLSANALVKSDDGFVSIRSYLDGGNQADAQYETLTLCAVAGTEIQWKNAEQCWIETLSKYGVDFLHTTDVLTLNHPYTREAGWSHEKANALLNSCVDVIERCKARPEDSWPHGIMPISFSIFLRDFDKAVREHGVTGRPELHLAMCCVQMCAHWADYREMNRLQFFFDLGEPFYGHTRDRWLSTRARKEETLWHHVSAITEVAMQETPALQIADMVAWVAGKGHENAVQYDWQERLLATHKENHLLDYDCLKSPDWEALECLQRWKIPQRKPFVLNRRGDKSVS